MTETVSRQKVEGMVSATLKAEGKDFVSQPVDQLELTYGGIAGDFHAGLTRASGAREPWYKRGTQLRNERQISLLADDELADIACNMELDKIEPGWVGCNLVIVGIKNQCLLPPRTVLIVEGGVTLRVDGYNAPCRFAGGAISAHIAIPSEDDADIDHTTSDIALAFIPAARLKRGLVAWVEREGVIRPGEKVTGHVWEQWLYQ